MKIFIMASVFLSLGSHAAICNVTDSSSAYDCIERDSYERYMEGELSHSVGVTESPQGKLNFETMTGKRPSAAFVGVVEVHYDEDQLLYYEIPTGKEVSPKLVREINIVDLLYEVPALEEASEEEREMTSRLSISEELIGGFHL